MRILFVSLIEALWGGSEVLWSRAAEELATEGTEVSAFFPYYKMPGPARHLSDLGVRLEFGTPPPTRWWRRLSVGAPSPHERFETLLCSFRPDLVVFNQGDAPDGIKGMASCKLLGLPYAILNQAVGPLFHTDAVWREMRASFQGARRIWFVSEENSRELKTFLAEPLPNAETIANAYGCSYNAELDWPKDDPIANDAAIRLAAVGRLDIRQKGHDLLLASLARPEWRARPAQVTLWGCGPNEEALRAQAKYLNLSSLSFGGHCDSITSIWKNHHALIMPSRFEGQSLAMIEAMLHARLVITTPVGGTEGVVIDGETGFMAESPTAEAWNAVMERAWLRRGEWTAIGRQACQHIRRIVSPSPGKDFARRIREVIHGNDPT